jgi:hypothetical protein
MYFQLMLLSATYTAFILKFVMVGNINFYAFKLIFLFLYEQLPNMDEYEHHRTWVLLILITNLQHSDTRTRVI